MEIVNFLAVVWGVFFITLPLSLLINPRRAQELFGKENVVCNYLAGLVSVVLGTMMVLTYNVWTKDWTVLITLFGWASLLKGLFLMFATEKAVKLQAKIKTASWMSYVWLVAIFLGLFLVYNGFSA